MANTPKLLEAFTTIQSEIYRYEVEKEQWEQEKTSYQLQINVLKAENKKFQAIQSHLQRRIDLLEKTLSDERNNKNGGETSDNVHINEQIENIQQEGSKTQNEQINDIKLTETPPTFSNLLLYNEKLKEISTKLTKLITNNIELPFRSTTSLVDNLQNSLEINNQNNEIKKEITIEELSNEKEQINENNQKIINKKEETVEKVEKSNGKQEEIVEEDKPEQTISKQSQNNVLNEENKKQDNNNDNNNEFLSKEVNKEEKEELFDNDKIKLETKSENNHQNENEKENKQDNNEATVENSHHDNQTNNKIKTENELEIENNQNNNNNADGKNNEINLENNNNTNNNNNTDNNNNNDNKGNAKEKWDEEEMDPSLLYSTIVIHPHHLINNDNNDNNIDKNNDVNSQSNDQNKLEKIVGGENGWENIDKKYLALLGGSNSQFDDSSFKKSNFVNWKPISTIRGHFDAIRTVQFHQELPLLLTGSDDCTLKLWNISPSSKITAEDFYTYYGHKKAILSSAITTDQSYCFSGSVDGTIIQWELPSDLKTAISDPFPQLGKASSYFVHEYKHKDAVWDLTLLSSKNLLFSASSDSSVKIFNYSSHSHKTIIPTTFSINQSNENQLLIGYNNGNINIYDIEKELVIKQLHHLNNNNNNNENYNMKVDLNKQLNKIISHTELPIAFAGYEDKFIRYFDLRSGECIYSMIAHQDSISTLTVDPSGSYLLSGGHDSSLRVWDIAQKSCVQEIQANRKKFDESILCASIHPKLNLVVSSGADSTLKFIKRSEVN